MTIYRMDSEEEALFRSYPYAVYYVQSPSTVSHANSAEIRNIHNNESISETFMNNTINTRSKESANRLALSHYSSSRGSTNSFLHEKKIPYDDVQSHGTGITFNEETNDDHHHPPHDQSNVIVVDHQVRNGYKKDHHDEYEEDDEEYFERNDAWWSILSFRHSDSSGWKFLQITWRFVLSIVVALVVFHLVTKPPPPKMSVKISRVSQFELAEGVDASGVTTKMLTCNCSINLVIDNKSKIFGLHLHPPFIQMSFGNLPFAVAQGPELQVGIGEEYVMLHVGTRNKPMYGAGRNMQDLLESNKGLPIAIHMKLRSSFRVVWGLINPKFHHQAQCLILVGSTYDKKHKSQELISKCSVSS